MNCKRAVWNRTCINNTVCKIINLETMNLDKNRKSVNSLDEKETFVNPELQNLVTLQKKQGKRLICHEIMMRLFLKCHNQKKRFPPFTRVWET